MRQRTDQEQARREKLEPYRTTGNDPYPARSERTFRLIDVRQHFDTLAKQKTSVTVAGRIRALRLHGGSMFVDLDDGTDVLQCFLTKEQLAKQYDGLTAALDLGDFIDVTGVPFTTKRGEQTIHATAVRIIAKALRPLPEKRRGLADVELRYRHRELDLIANPRSRAILALRGKLLAAIRDVLLKEQFLEVETPVLQPIPGGANARPFVTHHHALNVDLFLRIAPELYLKRLIIGGIERVFEIARCFRNEGIDHEHNPEFTQVEVYAAYTDYEWMMSFTERLLRDVAKAVLGTTTIAVGKHTVKLSPPFPRRTFRDVIKEYTDIDIEQHQDAKSLAPLAKKKGAEVTTKDHRAIILDELYKTFVRPRIIETTFIIDHPIELSPLAKKKPNDPRYVERFQLLVAGTELANAFSELNDPDDQRQRFEQQEKLRTAGDEEAQRVDEEFLEAMEYGMPPTSGLGIGIDRLMMLLANEHSIKEVIAFPTLKPKP